MQPHDRLATVKPSTFDADMARLVGQLDEFRAAAAKHPGSSALQTALCPHIVAKHAQDQLVELDARGRVYFGDTWVEPDGYSLAHHMAWEAFAHVGPMKGGQRRKVATDVLKLIAIRAHCFAGDSSANLALLFVDDVAMDSVERTWVGAAAHDQGVELVVVRGFADVVDSIRDIQAIQSR